MDQATRLRANAWRIARAALRAVDPVAAVGRALSREGDRLRVGERVYDLRRTRRVVVVGLGKAAAQMTRAVEEIFADRVEAGLAVTADGCAVPTTRVEVVEAGHPVPDARGLAAAHRIAALVDGAGEDDLVIVPISGGGSSLLPLPADDLCLEDLAQVGALLLTSGAPIDEVNAVRKHLSAIQGGQLARRAAPAQVVALILSDVPGDPLDAIASGPTVPDPTTYADAERVLRGYALWERAPVSVRRHIAAGVAGSLPETPKPGDPLFTRVLNVLVGTGRAAAGAALAEGEALGYRGIILTTTLAGEAREVGTVIAAVAQEGGAVRPAGGQARASRGRRGDHGHRTRVGHGRPKPGTRPVRGLGDPRDPRGRDLCPGHRWPGRAHGCRGGDRGRPDRGSDPAQGDRRWRSIGSEQRVQGAGGRGGPGDYRSHRDERGRPVPRADGGG